MSILKSAKKIAIEEAKKTARDVSREIIDIPKSVPNQVMNAKPSGQIDPGIKPRNILNIKTVDVGKDIKNFPKDAKKQVLDKDTSNIQTSPIAQVMGQTPYELEDKKSEEGERVSRFDQDVEVERKKRIERENAQTEGQEKLMQGPEAEEEVQPVVLPASPSRVPKISQRGKSTKIETGKSKH